MTLAPSLRRVILPVLIGLGIIGAIELALYLKYHPTFWQRTTWLVRDPYRGETFDRVMLFRRLSKFEGSQPNIISVGDSSGFFGLQSNVVNRYTHGVKYLSLNTGANHAYDGYKAVAEYMLQRSKGSIKYVVIYMFPQLAPTPHTLGDGELGHIAHDTLIGPLAYLTPPSAFLAPYAKYKVFADHNFHFGDPILNHVAALELEATLDQAKGWLPEFDIRIARIDGHLAYRPDKRTDLRAKLGLAEQSSTYSVLDDFNKMVKSYGATLAVAFAPVPERGIQARDPSVSEVEQALARFSRDNPDVKFLMPYVTLWGAEKFGTSNHVSREYTFLSSYRLGKALERLVTDPDSIPPFSPTYPGQEPYKPITVKATGQHDPELLNASVAYYLYSSTLDDEHKRRVSRRTLELLEKDQSYQFMMEDKRARTESLNQRKIKISFDLSQLRARPVEVNGLQFCASRPDTQWVQVDGKMGFVYESPTNVAREFVPWPEASHILLPTIVEDGIRKFDGYCPESDSTLDYSASLKRTK